MSKTLFGTLILILTGIVTILLVILVLDRYPTFGTFDNILWLGIVFFITGLGIWWSASLFNRAAEEREEANQKQEQNEEQSA
jgi:hypothetical protein